MESNIAAVAGPEVDPTAPQGTQFRSGNNLEATRQETAPAPVQVETQYVNFNLALSHMAWYLD